MAAIFYRCSGCDTKQISWEPVQLSRLFRTEVGSKSRPAESQRKSSLIYISRIEFRFPQDGIFCTVGAAIQVPTMIRGSIRLWPCDASERAPLGGCQGLTIPGALCLARRSVIQAARPDPGTSLDFRLMTSPRRPLQNSSLILRSFPNARKITHSSPKRTARISSYGFLRCNLSRVHP